MQLKSHLILTPVRLDAGSEWAPGAADWQMVRIGEGIVYWIGSRDKRELGPGDTLLASPAGGGIVRVSQLAEAHLQYFTVSPETLGGLLTVGERQALDSHATHVKNAPRFFKAGEPVARRFAGLGKNLGDRPSLKNRSELLRLFAIALEEELNATTFRRKHVNLASNRFYDLVERITERELIQFSIEEMAGLCGCSQRHLARLFRAQFGRSIRQKLTELRMEKARELLSGTNVKIAKIASESGYRHQGLFNVTFKKFFGVSPHQWRLRNTDRPPNDPMPNEHSPALAPSPGRSDARPPV